MKKLLLASLMLVGFAGIGMAQTAPAAKPATTTHAKAHVKGTHTQKHAGKHKHKKAAAAVK